MPSKHKQNAGQRSLAKLQKYFPKVKSLVDADESHTVEVTAHDDKTAHKLDHVGCALAVSCKRTFHLDGIVVSRTKAYLIKGDKATRYTLPEKVRREIVSFDRGGGFSPGEYDLLKPEKSERLGSIWGSLHRNRPPKKKLRHYTLTAGVRSVLGSKE